MKTLVVEEQPVRDRLRRLGLQVRVALLLVLPLVLVELTYIQIQGIVYHMTIPLNLTSSAKENVNVIGMRQETGRGREIEITTENGNVNAIEHANIVGES